MPHQPSQFEEILIPPVLLAGMYSRSLVIIDTVENAKPGGTAGANSGKATEPSVPAFVAVEKEKIVSESVVVPAITARINWLGGFAKKVLVILSDENSVHVSEAELELLVKMLAAVDLSMADIGLVNIAKQQISLEQLNSELPASTSLLFGVEPSSIGLPMRFPFFQVQKWNNGIYLYSPSLTQMNTVSEDQNDLKRNLWKALKEIFKK